MIGTTKNLLLAIEESCLQLNESLLAGKFTFPRDWIKIHFSPKGPRYNLE